MQENLIETASVTIRHARPNDAGSLAKLVFQLAAHHDDHATVDENRLKEDLFSSSPWAIAHVAEKAGELIGYSFLVRLYRAQFAERSMDIHHLFVVPDARNTGAGKALIDFAKAEAKAHRCTTLVVGAHPDNQRAQSFYRKLGFAESSRGGPKFKLSLGADG